MARKPPSQPDRREIAADLFRDHLDLGRIEKVVAKARQSELSLDGREPADTRPAGQEGVLQSARSSHMRSETPTEEPVGNAKAIVAGIRGREIRQDATNPCAGAISATTAREHSRFSKGVLSGALIGFLSLIAAGTYYVSAPMKLLTANQSVEATSQLDPGAVTVSRVANSETLALFVVPRPVPGPTDRLEKPSDLSRIAHASTSPAPIRAEVSAPRPEVSLSVAPIMSSAETRTRLRIPTDTDPVAIPAVPQVVLASIAQDTIPRYSPPPAHRTIRVSTIAKRRPPAAKLRPEPPQAERASAAAQTNRIVIHRPPGRARAQARELVAKLRSNGSSQVEVRIVDVRVSRQSIRYFFNADRNAARSILDSLPAARLQDFTSYQRLPKPGTLEIWLK